MSRLLLESCDLYVKILQEISKVKCFINTVILQYNRDINECIFLLYNNSVEYKEFQDILTNVHVDNNKIFQKIANDINSILQSSQSWDNHFADIRMVLSDRDKAKEIFQHYESKIIHLEKQYSRERREEQWRKLDRVTFSF
jgi:hypothetical protein